MSYEKDKLEVSAFIFLNLSGFRPQNYNDLANGANCLRGLVIRELPEHTLAINGILQSTKLFDQESRLNAVFARNGFFAIALSLTNGAYLGAKAAVREGRVGGFSDDDALIKSTAEVMPAGSIILNLVKAGRTLTVAMLATKISENPDIKTPVEDNFADARAMFDLIREKQDLFRPRDETIMAIVEEEIGVLLPGVRKN